MEKRNGSLSIGKALKEYRINHGITQAKLAERLEITPQYIGVLERGEKFPALNIFIRIAQITNKSPNVLLSDILGEYDESSSQKVIDELSGYSKEKKKLILDTLDAVYIVVKNHCETEM